MLAHQLPWRSLSDLRLRVHYAIIFTLIVSAAAAAQTSASPASSCGPSATAHQVLEHGSPFLHAIERAPRNAIRPQNLRWELPIAATTGILIAEADRPAADRIHSTSFQNLVSRWSNVGLGSEIAAGGAAWAVGCMQHRSTLQDAGLTALTAMGAAAALDLAVKLSFNRQFPYIPGSRGEFWEGGRSFASGHSATSFAFAAVIAQRYPHKRWVKWGAYGLAAAVSLSRYPAKRHYLSDILVGSTLGYVTGSYIAQH